MTVGLSRTLDPSNHSSASPNKPTAPDYKTKALSTATWADFAQLVEANNGVWGGCWCMWHHRKDNGETPAKKRDAKEALVREGRADAAPVYDGGTCVGWAQLGRPR